MFLAIHHTLDTAKALLDRLTTDQYCDQSVGPYYSSIGTHIRHILDVYCCICDGLPAAHIDLTARSRDQCVECDLVEGKRYIAITQARITALTPCDLDQIVAVCDDLGEGRLTFNTTLAGILVQAQSHATHHYASIGYILDSLDLIIPSSGFGFNPTTPRADMALKSTG